MHLAVATSFDRAVMLLDALIMCYSVCLLSSNFVPRNCKGLVALHEPSKAKIGFSTVRRVDDNRLSYRLSETVARLFRLALEHATSPDSHLSLIHI